MKNFRSAEKFLDALLISIHSGYLKSTRMAAVRRVHFLDFKRSWAKLEDVTNLFIIILRRNTCLHLTASS